MKIPSYILDDYRGDLDQLIDMPGLPVYAYYFNERERIRIRREEKNLPYPWTKCPILGEFRFTNIHREDDKVSRQLYQAIDFNSPPGTQLFNAFVFRTFNCQSGFDAAGGYHYIWHYGKALVGLSAAHTRGDQIFGSAYMMVNSMTAGAPKHEFYLKTFNDLWEQRTRFLKEMERNPTLESTTRLFTTIPGYADFLGYELALDMEMIDLLHPTDAFSWGNPGPGARKGLNFVFGRDLKYAQPIAKFLEEMRYLFKILPPLLHRHIDRNLIVMRCIENGLCETSKMARIMATGRAKRRYRGPVVPE